MQLLKERFPSWLARVQPSETAVLMGTALAVGAGTGLGAVLLIRLIAWIQTFFFETGGTVLGFLGRGLFVLAPAVGGLLAGPIIAYFAKEAKGHGVPEVMQAIALQGGRIRPRVALAKIVASALCIGSGGSAGREGPIVQVGAALGSTLGQWLRFSETRVRNLVACGAAAGIAATFNAPIAGVLFAMEIILGELRLGDMGNVVISAVTSAVVARVFLGAQPAFAIPNYSMRTAWEVLFYIPLGVLAAFLGVAFIRLLYGSEDLFDHWHFPPALKPAVGGLLLGLLAVLYLWISSSSLVPGSPASLPPIFGTGFLVIAQTLTGQLPFGLLLALAVLKPLATSLTLGSGNSGGIFAPSLFMGAALGGAFGWAVNWLAPGLTAGPGAFAIVGMAAVFAGAARAPFTAILIVFEMTSDYQLILPLMVAVILSLFVAERLHRDSIYTLKLSRRGIHLQQGKDLDVMGTVRVEEVMVRNPATVPATLPITMLASEFARTGRHGFAVLNEDQSLLGVVALEDYRRLVADGQAPPAQLTVRDIASLDVVSIYPDETIDTALLRMAPRDLSRLPVVARDNPRHLVGVVRRHDIIRAYEVGVMRREEARRRAETKLDTCDTCADFIDVPLSKEPFKLGKIVAELDLPRAAVVVSIRRGHDLMIPRGDTRLQAGDVVTVLCERDSIAAMQNALKQWYTADPATHAATS